MHRTLPNAGHRALAALEHARGRHRRDHAERRPAARGGGLAGTSSTCTAATTGCVCLACGHVDLPRGARRPARRRSTRGSSTRIGASRTSRSRPTPTPSSSRPRTSSSRPASACGGMLKPDIVYFGENVPRERVERAFAMVDAADALLVAGSSLTVQSGLRFVRHAAQAGKPVVVVNRGATRGDKFATVTLDAGTSETLTDLAETLPTPVSRAAPRRTRCSSARTPPRARRRRPRPGGSAAGRARRPTASPHAPAFGSHAPSTSRGTRASTVAPAHMRHGSSVTTRVQSSSRHRPSRVGGRAQREDLGVRRSGRRRPRARCGPRPTTSPSGPTTTAPTGTSPVPAPRGAPRRARAPSPRRRPPAHGRQGRHGGIMAHGRAR